MNKHTPTHNVLAGRVQQCIIPDQVRALDGALWQADGVSFTYCVPDAHRNHFGGGGMETYGSGSNSDGGGCICVGDGIET